MAVDLIYHTATLLQNGKVLIVGGLTSAPGGYVPVAAAEIYDPATGLFTTTGSLITPRAAHTATLLPNGTVLIAGGINSNGTVVTTAEIYTPATGLFTATGNMVDSESTATLMQNGLVLGTGAGGGPAETYNPATGTFTSVGEPLVSSYLEDDAAVLLSGGNVLVLGGEDGNIGTVFSAAELFNPATSKFTLTGSMTIPRVNPTATLLNNGMVLVAGGSSAELYNPTSGTFSATGSLTTARAEDTVTLLPNGMVLIAGGATTAALASAELYNPATGTFSATGSMTKQRADFAATLLPNGMVLMTGGGFSATAELYQS
jgi:hypothetical protein